MNPQGRATWKRLNIGVAARVIFGFGTLRGLPGELGRADCKRGFRLSDPHHAGRQVRASHGCAWQLAVHLLDDAVMHTPVDVTEAVMAKLVASNADCLGLARRAGRRIASQGAGAQD